MEQPGGTIIFTTVGRSYYGFDIFSVLLSYLSASTVLTERRLTDGVSINFNAQFIDEQQSITYISERTGSPRVYLTRSNNPNPNSEPEQLPTIPESQFIDRPTLKNGHLYFVSAHEPADQPFKSSSAVYSTKIGSTGPTGPIVRLTPNGAVDYSPAVSASGKFIAVASYEFRPWNGEFMELDTDIVIFKTSDPTQRKIVCKHGGWPTWAGDSTIFFHRKEKDGWWSVMRAELSEILEDFSDTGDIGLELEIVPNRVTPVGVHAFTPTASPDGKRIAVATRRKDNAFRHIEIFDLESDSFQKVTELINPNFHHYNPFISPEGGFLGYHRFRGESVPGELTTPYLNLVVSPVKELKLVRLIGSFPSVSADGKLIAFNHDFGKNAGLEIVKSDGSKKWTLIKGRTSFYTSWSKAEEGVIFTSIGPIFEAPKVTVQIARIEFDPKHLDDREKVECTIKILSNEESGNNAFPSCSPDGKHVVFRSGRSGHKNLYIVDAVNGEFSGEIRQLTEGPWIDTMPNWSPDGKLIAFSSNRHNPENSEAFSIYIIHPDGSGLRRVQVAGPEGSSQVDKERINHVCFSPDCKWLVFTANIGGIQAEPISLPNQFQPYGDLYVVRLDGSGLQKLTWNAYENGTPTWYGTGTDEVDLGSLALGEKGGDKLTGQIAEPYWLTCDI